MDNNTMIYVALGGVLAYVLVKQFMNRGASSEKVLDKIRSGAKIVDVRSSAEFAGGSYPKAKNIPIDVLASRLSELPKDKPVVLFCASGARAAQAVRILKKAGYTDVLSAGGLANMPRG